MIELTDNARDALAASATAARRFNPAASLRLSGSPELGVRSELVDAPSDGDLELLVDGLTLFVAQGLDGVVDVGEHNALTLRASRS